MTKVLSVVGARPQFVKLAPIAHALAGRFDHVIVHTGQHYDECCPQVFFDDLAIPRPDVDLEVGSGSHGAQTGAMLAAIEPVLQQHNPDWVLVYGDTNSTLAGAIAAVKLHLPIAHLEAGLRSFNRRMPEEHNRVLTDHAADLCLAPTEVAMGHLADEGLAARSLLVGDVMTDVCLATAASVRDSAPTLPAGVDRSATTSWRRSTGRTTPTTPSGWRRSSPGSPRSQPVLLLAHPRLVAARRALGVDLASGGVHVLSAQPYPELLRAGASTPAASSPTRAGCRRKPSCCGCRAPQSGPRPSGPRPSTWAGTCWPTTRPTSPPPSVAPAPGPTNATPYGDGHAADRVADALLG